MVVAAGKQRLPLTELFQRLEDLGVAMRSYAEALLNELSDQPQSAESAGERRVNSKDGPSAP